MDASPGQVLKDIFGYEDFRGPQREIIDELMAGRHALVLMPTGGGKSLCYQIPSLLRPGVGIVISPLIALMQDQVDALRELGVRASFLNSSLSADEQRSVLQSLRAGALDLLYVAPERLNQSATLDLLHSLDIALFAIDEAHCVSQWGHDFRVDYLQLSILQEQFPQVPRIALTATADDNTRAEIVERLGLGEARHFVSGFDRPNIQYRITQKQTPRQQLLRFLRREHEKDAGIVYCLSRKKVDDTAAWLVEQGFDAVPYHAGLSAEQRQRNQQRFLREDSVIVVATIAFGMGIDKPDVRFIVHLDLPKSLEAYYQETGRAGRDGEPATAWMVYGLQDVIMLRQMMDTSQGNEKFKRIERAKLDAMLGLCEITSCRRQALLHYFGEQTSAYCGNCDACLTPAPDLGWHGGGPQGIVLCVSHRAAFRRELSDRCAAGCRVGQVYSRTAISTCPPMALDKELEGNAWRSVFRQLVARGYLNVDHATYGGLHLNEKSRGLLKGEERIDLRIDVQEVLAKPEKKSRSGHKVADADKQLWDALRQCRKAFADEKDVPPYVIFHDASLMDMVHYRPLTEQQFLSISGVGQSKLEKYGDAFLQVIREHEPRH